MDNSLNETDAPDEASSFEQWQGWLKDKRKTAFRGWALEPDKLIGEHNGEAKEAREYQGREVLELIQNANDAARELGIEGSIRLELSPEGFIAANTGSPFTFGGIGSLRTANLSPKRGRQNMVGHKGLGFRAVLNWSRHPMILSGSLALAFSERERIKVQHQLLELGGELESRIRGEIKKPSDAVVPLLAVPAFGTDDEIAEALDDDSQRSLFIRCRDLRSDFDTVIGMAFERNGAFDRAKQQLQQLTPEVMLFAESISQIEIVISGEQPKTWMREASSDTSVRFMTNNAPSVEWRLHRKPGTIPNQVTGVEEVETSSFELVIAIPLGGVKPSGYLFSYFPTKVRFPFPFVCHATLALSANRDGISDVPANHYVLGELAAFVAETAEKEARFSSNDAGLRLITADGSHESLDRFKFGSLLIQAAKSRLIVPTLGLGVVSGSEARSVAIADTSWLPSATFGPVVAVSKQHPSFALLEKLSVPEWSDAEWQHACSNTEFASLEARAKFIGNVVKYEIKAAYSVQTLLLDESGSEVPNDAQVLLPPGEGKSFNVPVWCDARQLNPELCSLLQSDLQAQNRSDLATKLKPLGVAAYSLAGIVKALLAATKLRREQAPDSASDRNNDLLHALFSLFGTTQSDVKFPLSERAAPILVASIEGSWEDVQKVYLGPSYGTRGRLLDALYAFDSKKLIAEPNAMGFGQQGHDLAKFFVWLGAADLPRIQEANWPDKRSDFSEFVKVSIGKEAHFESYGLVHLAGEGDLYFEKLVTVDGLGKMLETAPYSAILAWLAHDDRAHAWRFKSSDHGKAGLCRGDDRRTRFYKGEIPSYARWRIQTTAWLIDRAGNKVSPEDCVADAGAGLSEIVPAPTRPAAEDAESFGIVPEQWGDAFVRAGVRTSLSNLDPSAVYALLRRLPEADCEGRHAKAVYQALLHHSDPAALKKSAAREQFLRDGTIWCKTPDGGQYYQVAEAWHVNSDDIPRTLRSTLKIADLPRRTSSANAEAILGVRPLNRNEIRKTVAAHTLHRDAVTLESEIERLKPLFFELRRSHSKSAKESAEFKSVAIRLCSHIEGSVEFQGSVPLSLEPWEWIWGQGEHKHEVYVFVNPGERDPMKSALLADTVGRVFASIFDLSKGDEFARLYGCRAEDRPDLLRRMMGDDRPPDLEELIQNYQATIARTQTTLLYEAPRTPVTSAEQLPSTLPVVDQPVDDAASAELNVGLESSEPTPLSVQKIEHLPVAEGGRVEFRNRSDGEPSSAPQSRPHVEQRVTNGTLCEEKVIEFEDHQGRFPLRVGNLQGYLAPGVDVLSFSTAEDLGRFVAGDRRAELVERFIEVKGRNHERAKIDLRENALTTASSRRQKYWLYRLHQSGSKSYRLSMLQDPISDPSAAKEFLEIDLDRSLRTERYTITGGIPAESPSP